MATRGKLIGRCLFLAGGLCLAHALVSLLLLALGARAPGTIVAQERTVTTRLATSVRYEFDDADGTRHSGRAMTAVPDARHVRIQVAYVPGLPFVNRPADGPYVAVIAAGWTLLGLCLLAMGRGLSASRGRRPRRTPA